MAAQRRARPLDALRVATPDRFVYALEARQRRLPGRGARRATRPTTPPTCARALRALLAAPCARYRPYRARVRPGRRPRSRSGAAAQIFLSNLPYFGFGFEVDPGADPADGRFEAIVMEARSRAGCWRCSPPPGAAATSAGAASRACPPAAPALTKPCRLVADALPLGTTTATVTVEPARLRVAAPARER